MRKNRILIVMLFVIGFGYSATAKEPINDSTKICKNNYNIRQFVLETGQYYTQPIRWGVEGWVKTSILLGATLAIKQGDQKVRDYGKENPKYNNSLPIQFGNQWGGFYITPGMIIGLGIYGHLGYHPLARKMCFEMLESVLFSEGVSLAMKASIGRARPNTNLGPCNYTPFTIFDSPHNSFPAGHVNAAFAMSTILAKNTESDVLKVVFYLPSICTAAARIYTDWHWTSDVVFGSVLGYASALWAFNLHEKNNDSKLHVSSIYPLSIQYSLNNKSK